MPAQKRPAGSHLPSLNRVAVESCSGGRGRSVTHPVARSKTGEALLERQHQAAARARHHRADFLANVAGTVLPRDRIVGEDALPIDVDPMEAPEGVIPDRAFAEQGLGVDHQIKIRGASHRNLGAGRPYSGATPLHRRAARRLPGRAGVTCLFGKLRNLGVQPQLAAGIPVEPENLAGVLDEDRLLARLFRHLQAGVD